jgi:hypothetical protein
VHVLLVLISAPCGGGISSLGLRRNALFKSHRYAIVFAVELPTRWVVLKPSPPDGGLRAVGERM